MIKNKPKKAEVQDQADPCYIYYDTSDLNLKKKVSFTVVLENYLNKKLLITVDYVTREIITMKILENLENIHDLSGLLDCRPHLFKIDNQNGERIKIKDFSTQVYDGAILYCKIRSNSVWIKTKVSITTFSLKLKISFEIMTSLYTSLRAFKLMLIKRSINEWAKLDNDQLHYTIGNSSLKISIGKVGIEEYLNKFKSEEELDNLKVGSLFHFSSEVELMIEFLPVEMIFLTKLQEKLIVNSRQRKLSDPAFRFINTSFHEFLYNKDVVILKINKHIQDFLTGEVNFFHSNYCSLHPWTWVIEGDSMNSDEETKGQVSKETKAEYHSFIQSRSSKFGCRNIKNSPKSEKSQFLIIVPYQRNSAKTSTKVPNKARYYFNEIDSVIVDSSIKKQSNAHYKSFITHSHNRLSDPTYDNLKTTKYPLLVKEGIDQHCYDYLDEYLTPEEVNKLMSEHLTYKIYCSDFDFTPLSEVRNLRTDYQDQLSETQLLYYYQPSEKVYYNNRKVMIILIVFAVIFIICSIIVAFLA